MYSDYQRLTFARRGPILTITMDNPSANAVDAVLHTELARVFLDVQRDPNCRIAILTGAGRFFSAGGDLNQMLANLDDLRTIMKDMGEAPDIIGSLLALEKPIIAQVNGHAMGIAASLALLCDIVFMAENAKIADPHVPVGLCTGDGGALLWPHLIGYARARHHLFTGDPLTGVEAAQLGLIYKALPAEELADAVNVYADRLAALPFQALSATKQAINMPLRRQAQSDSAAHIRLETRNMLGPDHREAVEALLAKREPKFTHQ